MIVLDASVVLKWLLPEKESEKALQYRDAHREGIEHIVVPTLLFYEVANVLRLQTEIHDEALHEIFEIFDQLGITVLHSTFTEFEETIRYARSKNISVYDATYIVLAKRLGCDFVTADTKLVLAADEETVRLLA